MSSNRQTYTITQLINLIPKPWRELVGENEFNKTYWSNIINILNESSFFPTFENIFHALSLIEPNNVKCVIIGQDPYIKNGQAHGLSFSVTDGVTIPPSLRNIYHEILNEYLKDKTRIPIYLTMFHNHGDLTQLAKQGVLFLNSVLTVKPLKSNSHKNIGWENFTGRLLECLDRKYKFVVMAWGNQAKNITNEHIVNNKVLIYGHPSPLNTTNPFIGCNCFKECNKILKNELHTTPINWIIIFTQSPSLFN